MQYLRMWTAARKTAERQSSEGEVKKESLFCLVAIFICALNAATFCLRPPKKERAAVVAWTNANLAADTSGEEEHRISIGHRNGHQIIIFDLF